MPLSDKHSNNSNPRGLDAFADQASRDERTRASFEREVWQPYEGRLRNFLVRTTNDCELVEDLLSTVAMKAWRGYGQLRDKDKVRPWLYRIARNEIVDFTCKPISHMLSLNDPRVADATSNRLEQPEVAALVRHKTELLVEALSLLTKEELHLIALAYDEELTRREMAEILEIKVGTVWSRLSAATKKLQQILKGLGYEV